MVNLIFGFFHFCILGMVMFLLNPNFLHPLPRMPSQTSSGIEAGESQGSAASSGVGEHGIQTRDVQDLALSLRCRKARNRLGHVAEKHVWK
jgi:hypothetical protein